MYEPGTRASCNLGCGSARVICYDPCTVAAAHHASNHVGWLWFAQVPPDVRDTVVVKVAERRVGCQDNVTWHPIVWDWNGLASQMVLILLLRFWVLVLRSLMHAVILVSFRVHQPK